MYLGRKCWIEGPRGNQFLGKEDEEWPFIYLCGDSSGNIFALFNFSSLLFCKPNFERCRCFLLNWSTIQYCYVTLLPSLRDLLSFTQLYFWSKRETTILLDYMNTPYFFVAYYLFLLRIKLPIIGFPCLV
jgi:hypothetical protein